MRVVGSWRPANLATVDILIIKVILAVEALSRSADYLIMVDAPAVMYGGLETVVPVQVWAVLCFLVAVLLAFGVTVRCHFSVYAGHAVGAVVYAALTVAAVQFVFELPEPDGWRRVMPLLLIAFLHFVLALRSGPKPLPRNGRLTATIDVGVPQ